MKNIIYILIILLTLSSCGITKREHSDSTIIKEKIEKNKDSSNVIENNKAIKDKATIAITESNTGDRNFDEAVNKAVTSILRSINFQKTSGDNSYKFYYDERLKELRAEFEIGATQNKEVTTNENSKEKYSVVKEVEDYIKKIIIPWWAYLILLYLLRKPVINIIGMFFPAVRGIKSVQDLLTPPKKD